MTKIDKFLKELSDLYEFNRKLKASQLKENTNRSLKEDEAKALTISLVAEVDERVVGHIAFSPVTTSDGATHWYGLGPVSVLPEYQRQGIGKALIKGE